MQYFCRTCFKQISNINTTTSLPLGFENNKWQLIFCIPEMDLRLLPDAKLCNDCIAILLLTYNFKIKCQEVEEKINKGDFNVIERFMIKPEFGVDNSIYAVCRTCLKDILDNDHFSTERSFYKNKLIFCVPEMDLQFISVINLCNKCHTVIDEIYLFKIKCLYVEKNIKEYLNLYGDVELECFLVWWNAFAKCEVNDRQDFTIKQEEVDLKNENLEEEFTNSKIILGKEKVQKACGCTKETLKYHKCKCSVAQKHNLHESPNTNKKQFSSLDSVAQITHLKKYIKTHIGKKPFKCSLCEYSATHKSILEVHIRKHTGEKPFKCSLCKYSATIKSNLQNHIQSHTAEKPFKCSLCEYSTARKYDLKLHIHTHTGENLFKCSLCKYSATHKSKLELHIRKHTGEKPFKCLLCEYSTARKHDLKLHIHTHTGEKLFKCSLCEYRTARKYGLKLHVRTHTGEKPFKCSLCEYSAIRKSSLKNHINTHTVLLN